MQLHLEVVTLPSLIHGMPSFVCCCYAISQTRPRFRQITTFGSGTIRRFSNNVSERKKLAARDYEDILQVNSKVSSDHVPNLHSSYLEHDPRS
jgi:hypothetical protein